MTDDSFNALFKLTDVTMMEAVNALRERGVFIQFEREQLWDQDTDWSKPVVDSRRRFSVSLALNQPVNAILNTLTRADAKYDWIQLTKDPATCWIFPHSQQEDRFALSAMAWKVGAVSTVGRPFSELVFHDLGLEDHQITVFDRASFLAQVTATPEVKTEGRPLYGVLGELFARSGKPIIWTLGGLGDARVLSIGMLSPS